MPDRIEVAIQTDRPDPAGASLKARLKEDLGIEVGDIRVIDVFTFNAALSADELEKVRTELFTDPIIQTSALNQALAEKYDFIIEVGFLPGVTDNVGKSSVEGVQDTLGRRLAEGEAIFKSTQYAVSGASREVCERIAHKALANELIEQWIVKSPEEVAALQGGSLLGLPIVTDQSEVTVREIDLEIADEALMQLSRDMMLALDLSEMKAIQAHYRDEAVRAKRAERGLPAAPTDIEIEILAQTWSEHCKHKIFNAEIAYTDEAGKTRTIDSIFRTYVKADDGCGGEKSRLADERLPRQRGHYPL